MKKISAILLLLVSTLMGAQEFYLVNENNIIYTYDYSNGQVSLLTIVNLPGQSILDIAYADSNHLYAITDSDDLIDIDVATGNFVIIHEFLGNFIASGLVYSPNNDIILINSGLSTMITFDLDTGSIVSDVFIGEENSGDITFFKGNVLFQGITSQDIFAYANGTITSVACTDTVGLYGMSNYFTDCNNNLVLAFDDIGRVLEYDIDGQTYEEIDTVLSTVGVVYGATTINEQFAYDCPLVELEEISCELGVRDNNQKLFYLYPNPSSETIYIQSANSYETIRYTIYTISGMFVGEGIYGDGINITSLASGMYFLKLSTETSTTEVASFIKH